MNVLRSSRVAVTGEFRVGRAWNVVVACVAGIVWPTRGESLATLARARKRRMTTVSVVVPTKDRPQLLRRCLDAVKEQEFPAEFEIIVVNDQGCAVDGVVNCYESVRLVSGSGLGPAAARNAGIARATGEIVVFTDDDAIPQAGWIHAAVAALASNPTAVGVVGRVESPPFDPLYEHSVESVRGVGNFLTCNAAYRRRALMQVGGFDEGFPYAAAEDRDLGYRMQELGPVLYEQEMLVVHPPRAVRIPDVVRRGRLIESEWRLNARHPQTRPPRWSARWGPLIRVARHWQRLLVEDQVVGGSPRRGVRLATMAAGQIAVALYVTVRKPRSPAVSAGSRAREGGPPPTMRVAWVGPTPRRGGAVAGCAWELVSGLARLGCGVDCFLVDVHEDIPEELARLPRVRVVNLDTGWRFDRWYSNNATSKVVSGLAAAAWGRRRLASLVLEQHESRPYDVIYQFSTIELFGLRRHLRSLPSLVLHPETHAAGELRGMRAERDLSARCEPVWRRAIVEALLITRARRQRRDLNLADGVVAISRRFGEHLVSDYAIDPRHVSLVPNPITLDEFRHHNSADRPQRHVAFVGRISVRKGIEHVVDLSHRLADLEGSVFLDVVGAETLWSDYRPLLVDLNPRVARYRGPLPRMELVRFLAEEVDVLIQPASFEPFGLTVAEALASGVPVVVTDEVGAAEGVSEECCIVVPVGDGDALEKGVREMLRRLEVDEGAIRSQARAEAERLFAPDRVASLVLDVIANVAGGPQRARSGQFPTTPRPQKRSG